MPAGANHQRVGRERHLAPFERLMLLHPPHGGAHVGQGLGRGRRAIGRDPGAQLAHVRQVHEVGVEPAALASPAKGTLVLLGRAGGNHHARQLELGEIDAVRNVRTALAQIDADSLRHA
jgi:hypothetical protein